MQNHHDRYKRLPTRCLGSCDNSLQTSEKLGARVDLRPMPLGTRATTGTLLTDSVKGLPFTCAVASCFAQVYLSSIPTACGLKGTALFSTQPLKNKNTMICDGLPRFAPTCPVLDQAEGVHATQRTHLYAKTREHGPTCPEIFARNEGLRCFSPPFPAAWPHELQLQGPKPSSDPRPRGPALSFRSRGSCRRTSRKANSQTRSSFSIFSDVIGVSV